MFEGLYGMYGNRISDIGGRRVLGMGGSLNAYIRTGNAYSGVNNAGVKNNANKAKIRANVDKFITFGTIAAAIGAVVFSVKNGKLNKDVLKSAQNRAKTFFSSFKSGTFGDDIKNAFNDFKNKASSAAKKARSYAQKAAKSAKSKAKKYTKGKDIVPVNIDVDIKNPTGEVVARTTTPLRYIEQ